MTHILPDTDFASLPKPFRASTALRANRIPFDFPIQEEDARRLRELIATEIRGARVDAVAENLTENAAVSVVTHDIGWRGGLGTALEHIDSYIRATEACLRQTRTKAAQLSYEYELTGARRARERVDALLEHAATAAPIAPSTEISADPRPAEVREADGGALHTDRDPEIDALITIVVHLARLGRPLASTLSESDQRHLDAFIKKYCGRLGDAGETFEAWARRQIEKLATQSSDATVLDLVTRAVRGEIDTPLAYEIKRLHGRLDELAAATRPQPGVPRAEGAPRT